MGDIKPESAPRFVSTHFFENKEQKQPKRKEAKREDQPVQDPVPPEGKNDPNKGQNASGTENGPLVVNGALMKNKPIQP